MRALGRRLLAVLLGLLLFWAGAELASRLLFRQIVRYDVEMWRYAREVKAVGLTPGLRFEHRPGVRARLMGVDVAINNDGLREREIPRTKRPGVVRVAVVGDSVTFGWGVPQDQTYPRQLEAMLNVRRPLGEGIAFEVINFGVGNYAIGDVAAMLEHKALAYDPDLVIYGAFINDAELPAVTSETPVLRHSLFAVWLWGRLDTLWRQWGWREDFRTYYNGLYRVDGPGRPRVFAALRRMAAACDERRIPLVVAMLPELHEQSDQFFGPVRAFYREVSTAAGADFVDLNGALPGEGRRRFWVSADDAHPNAEACRRYAGFIADGVRWQELLRQRMGGKAITGKEGES